MGIVVYSLYRLESGRGTGVSLVTERRQWRLALAFDIKMATSAAPVAQIVEKPVRAEFLGPP